MNTIDNSLSEVDLAKRVATLTTDQRQRLTTIIAEIRQQVHGNDMAWRSIDWNAVINGVVLAVPANPVPEWMQLWLPQYGTIYEHLTLSDLRLDAQVATAMDLIARLSPGELPTYLDRLTENLLAALEAKLVASVTPPVARRRMNV